MVYLHLFPCYETELALNARPREVTVDKEELHQSAYPRDTKRSNGDRFAGLSFIAVCTALRYDMYDIFTAVVHISYLYLVHS